jgi:serine/threonine-protein kinase
MLAAGLVGVVWAIFGRTGGENSGTSQTPSTSPMTSLTAMGPTAPEPAAPSQSPIKSLPGTERLGWINYPSARCDPGNQPVVMARTTQSVLVVCQIQPGNFYYRGVRLSDGASIELASAVRSSAGFDVTNPTDGSRYQIRPTTRTIAPPDGPPSSEPMLQYASG